MAPGGGQWIVGWRHPKTFILPNQFLFYFSLNYEKLHSIEFLIKLLYCTNGAAEWADGVISRLAQRIRSHTKVGFSPLKPRVSHYSIL